MLPWRLAALAPERRRPWALALLPLLITGALAAFGHVQRHPDAAVVQGLYPLGASPRGGILAVLFPALALADALLAAGWRRLEAAGWRIAAGFGLAFLLAASWAAELLRVGEGPASAPLAFLALVAPAVAARPGRGRGARPRAARSSPWRPAWRSPSTRSSSPPRWPTPWAPRPVAHPRRRPPSLLRRPARWLPAPPTRRPRPSSGAAALLAGPLPRPRPGWGTANLRGSRLPSPLGAW